MILYPKYLEDNINDKFNREMDEYKKYVKLFYGENSKCPVDLKTLLEKKENEKEINLWCKMKSGKNWNVNIKKPLVLNLNIKLQEITDKYNNECIFFKNSLKKNLTSSVYLPENDKELEKKLGDLKNIEKELELLRDVFEKERVMIEQIIKERQEILKKLLEIKIKKNNIYEKCVKISGEIKNKIMEIVNNEKEITAGRLEQIAKNVELKPVEVKNWIDYLNYVKEYLEENGKLDKLNNDMIKLKEKFDKINSFYVIEPPVVEISDKLRSEEVVDEKKERKLEIKPKSNKIKIKIRRKKSNKN